MEAFWLKQRLPHAMMEQPRQLWMFGSSNRTASRKLIHLPEARSALKTQSPRQTTLFSTPAIKTPVPMILLATLTQHPLSSELPQAGQRLVTTHWLCQAALKTEPTWRSSVQVSPAVLTAPWSLSIPHLCSN